MIYNKPEQPQYFLTSIRHTSTTDTKSLFERIVVDFFISWTWMVFSLLSTQVRYPNWPNPLRIYTFASPGLPEIYQINNCKLLQSLQHPNRYLFRKNYLLLRILNARTQKRRTEFYYKSKRFATQEYIL